jgi:hypothetical protein
VFIVLLLPEIGSIAWLVLGRPWNAAATAASAGRPKAAPGFGQLSRPNRRVPTNPDDDEEFLASLRKRTEEQRRSCRNSAIRATRPNPSDLTAADRGKARYRPAQQVVLRRATVSVPACSKGPSGNVLRCPQVDRFPADSTLVRGLGLDRVCTEPTDR